jgi:hypothetical protein
VSHRQLLLRSNRSKSVATRVEVLFKNVTAISLPVHLEGLSIAEASASEAARISAAHGGGLERDQKVFAVTGRNYHGHVIAGAIYTAEDAGDYAEASALLQA